MEAGNNRQLNLILLNVPESDSVDADIRTDDDKNVVQEALHDIGIETATVTDCQRLGKPDPSTDNVEKKKHSLRLTIGSLAEKNAVMKNAPKL